MKLGLFIVAVGVLACLFAGPAWASQCAAPTKAVAIDVPAHPFGLAASGDECWLFVSLGSDHGRGGVAVLRNQHGVFALDHVASIEGAGFGEALTRDGRILAVATDDGVVLLDVARLESHDASPLLGTLHDGVHPGSIYAAMGPDDRLLFVSEESAHSISVFDLAEARHGDFRGSALVGRIPMGIAPVGLAISPDGRWLYATSEVAPAAARLPASCEPESRRQKQHAPGALFRIDIGMASTDPAHAVVATALAGCNPVRVAVAPSGRQLWVTARGSDALLRFQESDFRPGHGSISYARFQVGPGPVGVAVRADDSQVWVALSNRFADGAQGRLVGLMHPQGSSPASEVSLAAAGFPREVAFLPDGRVLAATLFDAQRVVLLPTPP